MDVLQARISLFVNRTTHVVNVLQVGDAPGVNPAAFWPHSRGVQSGLWRLPQVTL